MKTATTPTHWVEIEVSGPVEAGLQILRRECLSIGLCVSVTPTTYVYSGGEERGYRVRLVNYPRFPKAREVLEAEALRIAECLRKETFQHSVLLMTLNTTTWITERE